MSWLWLILAGAVVGLLGKFFAPGDKDNVPIWLTVVLGIGGVICGRFVAGALGVEHTSGADWIKWALEIGIAVVLVMATSVYLAKKKKVVPPA